jgi:6-phosphogluconolactonase (cycloisomerase 2 family)
MIIKYLVALVLAGLVQTLPGDSQLSKAAYETYLLGQQKLYKSSRSNDLSITNTAWPSLIGSDGTTPQISLAYNGTDTATGVNPFAIRDNGDGKYLYVTSVNESKIYQYSINQTTGVLTPIGTPIATGSGPYSIQMDGLKKFIFVANQNANTVSGYVINAVDGTLSSTGAAIATESVPFTLISDGLGRWLYVANRTSNTLSQYSIHPTTGVLTNLGSTVATGTTPWGIANDGTGRYIYVSNRDSADIITYAINQSTGLLTVVGSPVAIGGAGYRICNSGTGKYIYVGDKDNSKIVQYSINQTTGALTQIGSPVSIGATPYGMTTDGAGQYLFVVSQGADTVTQFTINQSTGGLSRVGPVLKKGAGSFGILVVPEVGGLGRFLYAPNYTDRTISQYRITYDNRGMYVSGANTNLIAGRQSLETWAAGSPTGWVETNAGACNWTQDLTTRADNRSSALATEDGSGTYLTGPCSTGGIGAEIEFSAYAKKVSGTPTCTLSLAEYSVNNCTGALATTAIVSPILTTSWAKYKAVWDGWNVSTLSWTPIISCTTATAASSNWDAISMRSTAVVPSQSSFCGVDAATTAVCNATVVSGTNNIGNGSFHFRMTVNTPYDWTLPTSELFYVPATPASNRNKMSLTATTNTLSWSVWNDADIQKTATVACAGTANTDVTVDAYHTAVGGIKVCCNGLCGTTTTGADLAKSVVAGDSISLYFCRDGYVNGTYCVGVGGSEIAYVRSIWPTILAKKPTTVFIHSGVNDLMHGRSAVDMAADMEYIAASADANGIRFIVDNVGTYTAYTAGMITELLAYNTWLATTFAAAHPTAIILDFLTWAEDGSGDPKVCNALWFDAYCLHPIVLGNTLWGAVVNAYIAKGPGTTFYLGNGVAGGDVWIRNFKFYKNAR